MRVGIFFVKCCNMYTLSHADARGDDRGGVPKAASYSCVVLVQKLDFCRYSDGVIYTAVVLK